MAISTCKGGWETWSFFWVDKCLAKIHEFLQKEVGKNRYWGTTSSLCYSQFIIFFPKELHTLKSGYGHILVGGQVSSLREWWSFVRDNCERTIKYKRKNWCERYAWDRQMKDQLSVWVFFRGLGLGTVYIGHIGPLIASDVCTEWSLPYSVPSWRVDLTWRQSNSCCPYYLFQFCHPLSPRASLNCPCVGIAMPHGIIREGICPRLNAGSIRAGPFSVM